MGGRDPLKPPTGWLFWAGVGTLSAPAIVGATAAAFEAISPQVGANCQAHRQSLLQLSHGQCMLDDQVAVCLYRVLLRRFCDPSQGS